MNCWTSMVAGSLILTFASAVHAGDDLAKALQAVSAANSYSFTLKDESANSSVEARYQKTLPLYAKADKIEFFRKADVLVYKQKDVWQKTRTGTLSDPLLILGASAKVRAIKLPHDELALLGKSLANVKKADAILSGDIPEEAAKRLARSEDRDLARGGTAKLWLDGDGRLVKYEIAIRVQGRRGNAEVDGTMVRTVTVGDLGKTKVEVPEGAKKALE